MHTTNPLESLRQLSNKQLAYKVSAMYALMNSVVLAPIGVVAEVQSLKLFSCGTLAVAGVLWQKSHEIGNTMDDYIEFVANEIIEGPTQ